MPHRTIKRTCRIPRTPRVIQVESAFDVPPTDRPTVSWDVTLPLDDRPWNIGLICGPSGCGKSIIASEFWPKHVVSGFRWSARRACIDDFPKHLDTPEIQGFLTGVGLSSIPTWLRPYRVLSTGEQFRATLARSLCTTKPVVVFDEFTSVVDRDVAKVASAAVAKLIRRMERPQFVAVSCHTDIIDWLQPDWLYQPDRDRFAWRSVQPRPQVDLTVHRVDRSAWPVFRPHHYLSGKLISNARCWGGFLGKRCIAFSAVRPMPHPVVRNVLMGHRLVVLPEFQGLGIGGKFDDLLGEALHRDGHRYRNRVAHPAMIAHYAASPRWRRLPAAKLPKMASDPFLLRMHTQPRLLATASFEYSPPTGERNQR